jgi:hypothetical protein
MQEEVYNKDSKIFLLKCGTVQYLGSTLMNQNSSQEEIRGRLKTGSACFHSVQNFLSSSLLSNDINIKIHKNIILPVALYGCETWSLTMREVFENMVLRRIFGPNRGKV